MTKQPATKATFFNPDDRWPRERPSALDCAYEIMDHVNALVVRSKETETSWDVNLTAGAYDYVSSVRFPSSDVTALQFLTGTSPYIRSIRPCWIASSNAR